MNLKHQHHEPPFCLTSLFYFLTAFFILHAKVVSNKSCSLESLWLVPFRCWWRLRGSSLGFCQVNIESNEAFPTMNSYIFCIALLPCSWRVLLDCYWQRRLAACREPVSVVDLRIRCLSCEAQCHVVLELPRFMWMSRRNSTPYGKTPWNVQSEVFASRRFLNCWLELFQNVSK